MLQEGHAPDRAIASRLVPIRALSGGLCADPCSAMQSRGPARTYFTAFAGRSIHIKIAPERANRSITTIYWPVAPK
jgi:hypothetical protein